jgi:hypothetical protein
VALLSRKFEYSMEGVSVAKFRTIEVPVHDTTEANRKREREELKVIAQPAPLVASYTVCPRVALKFTRTARQ